MSKLRITRAVVPALLLLAGCGDATGPGDSEPITELPRALTVAEQTVISNGNAFGVQLLRQTVARDRRPNVVLSPLSASMALGMLLNGAEEGTFEAMRSTLGFSGMSRQEINNAYAGLITLLTELDPDVEFDIANSVWANKDVVFQQAFLDAVRTAFQARVESRDFRDPATLTAINGWVSDNTQGLIDTILDQLDPELVTLLINAIYFEGAWTTRFDPAKTRRADFRREDGSTVQVDMMNLDEGKLPLGFGPGYAAVELPYGGQAYSMVVLVSAEPIRSFVDGLDAAGWQAIVDGLSPREVDLVAIPKFKLAYDAYLNDPLKAMGMEVAFGPGADFSGMIPGGHNLCIDFVRQKTYIEVDERGTKAAAVTAVGVRPNSFNGIIADEPFAFAIRERLSGTLVFVGIVGDPTAPEEDPEPFTSTCR